MTLSRCCAKFLQLDVGTLRPIGASGCLLLKKTRTNSLARSRWQPIRQSMPEAQARFGQCAPSVSRQLRKVRCVPEVEVSFDPAQRARDRVWDHRCMVAQRTRLGRLHDFCLAVDRNVGDVQDYVPKVRRSGRLQRSRRQGANPECYSAWDVRAMRLRLDSGHEQQWIEGKELERVEEMNEPCVRLNRMRTGLETLCTG